MNIVIIEDERPAFNRLSKQVKGCMPAAIVHDQLDGIAAVKSWLSSNASPDLAFMDIHLADGSAFDLLEEVNLACPIIFTTAYDRYAIEAFKSASVDYLLKPVKTEELRNAFAKLEQLRLLLHKDELEAEKAPVLPLEYKKRFMIRFGEHIKILETEHIAYFYSGPKGTLAMCLEGKSFPVEFNLDALEKMLDPSLFFRANRQYLISVRSIDSMKTFSKARVIITLRPEAPDQPIVSSERAAQFKQWLSGD